MPGHLEMTAVGHLGRDAELRHTQSGTSVLSWSMACNVYRGAQRGKEATWIEVAVFGQRAEKMPKPSKGEAIMVVGTPELDTYTTRDGEQRTKLKLNAREVVLLGGRSGEGAPRDDGPSEGPSQSQGGADFGDDDIPF